MIDYLARSAKRAPLFSFPFARFSCLLGGSICCVNGLGGFTSNVHFSGSTRRHTLASKTRSSAYGQREHLPARPPISLESGKRHTLHPGPGRHPTAGKTGLESGTQQQHQGRGSEKNWRCLWRMATAPLSLFLFLTGLFLWLSWWLCLSNNSPRSGQATTRCRGSGLRVRTYDQGSCED
ncbi:hypothetical protein V8C44DRAFT_320004 [Trichoderma aethiopicum]